MAVKMTPQKIMLKGDEMKDKIEDDWIITHVIKEDPIYYIIFKINRTTGEVRKEILR